VRSSTVKAGALATRETALYTWYWEESMYHIYQ
jgi:hypothetical protein